MPSTLQYVSRYASLGRWFKPGTRWQDLARQVGRGLRELLSSPEDFEEAFLTCDSGLLAHQQVGIDQLRAIGLRLLQDAIVPLESLVS